MTARDVESTAMLVARRYEFLRSVRDEPQTKRSLVQRRDVSRSTVDRAVRGLESEGLLERREGRVRLTLAGRLALDAYERFADALVGIDEAGPVLETLPSDAAFDVDLVRGADMVEAESHAPHRPIEALDDLLADATYVRTYATMVIPEIVTTFRDRLVEGNCTVEVVADEPVVDALVSEHATALDDAIRTGQLELYETAASTPAFTFLVADREGGGCVGATIHGERGVTVLLKNDRSAAIEWLLERYDSLREGAERLA